MNQALNNSRLLNYLNSQAVKPSGIFGKVTTKLWPSYFKKLSQWSLEKVDFKNAEMILDVGFGGGINCKNLLKKI